MADSEAITEVIRKPEWQLQADAMMRSAADAKPMNLASFDPATPQGGKMMVQATLMECIPLKDRIGMDLFITDFFCHIAGSTDEDGEFDEFTRIVLFDTDGAVYQCAARGVLKSLAVMAYVRNSLHFDPPIMCKIKLLQLQGKKQWLTLIPDLESIGAKPVKHK